MRKISVWLDLNESKTDNGSTKTEETLPKLQPLLLKINKNVIFMRKIKDTW